MHTWLAYLLLLFGPRRRYWNSFRAHGKTILLTIICSITQAKKFRLQQWLYIAGSNNQRRTETLPTASTNYKHWILCHWNSEYSTYCTH